MSECGCQVSPSGRAAIVALFAAGKAQQAVFHRYQRCVMATDCRRLCPAIVKAPGVASTYCIGGAGKRDLYELLADPAASCPQERW